MNDTAGANLLWSSALLDGLTGAGVRHVVISPGSRSTPLVLACERHPGLDSHVLVDERCAGFFALGLAKAERRPVALICTSGTAAANWYPAVVEANCNRVPLILLTADRPPELQGWGANQTIDQLRLFGSHVRAFHGLAPAEASPATLRGVQALGARAVEQSRWPLPGPVHINVPLREPLVPGAGQEMSPLLSPPEAERGFRDAVIEEMPRMLHPTLQPPPQALDALARRLSGRAGLIVCGGAAYDGDFPNAVTRLAQVLDCPVLADPLSGLRCGPHDRSRILCRYDAFLRRRGFAATHRPDWVLRFGDMPVSKALQQYLESHPSALHILADPHGRWPDPLHLTTDLVRADPATLCAALAAAAPAAAPGDWTQEFLAQEHRALELSRCGADDDIPYEGAVVATLNRLLPAGSILFSSNSMAIRDLDSFLGPREQPLEIHANRGASGIDGNLSTLLGIAAASGRTPVVGLVGDLAFYHDMNGLLAARGLDATIILLNNNGGGIFRYLPQATLPGFTRHWLTPTDLDFEHAARLYGLHYRRVERQAEFADALATALTRPGTGLIEVMIDGEASAARHRAYWAAVAEAP
ncbi:MAG: 2-succinyl-5-enolpyruvyl-6-hydroxy-3-cyclohexene-1-carboxylic-acid synthase [Gammaproteobacteria bacterium]